MRQRDAREIGRAPLPEAQIRDYIGKGVQNLVARSLEAAGGADRGCGARARGVRAALSRGPGGSHAALSGCRRGHGGAGPRRHRHGLRDEQGRAVHLAAARAHRAHALHGRGGLGRHGGEQEAPPGTDAARGGEARRGAGRGPHHGGRFAQRRELGPRRGLGSSWWCPMATARASRSRCTGADAVVATVEEVAKSITMAA